MYYEIRHITGYRYSEPIRESQMDLRMQPRSEGPQRCWNFRLTTNPRADVSSHYDVLGNCIHHFDIPAFHTSLAIVAEALVEIEEPPPVPDALDPSAWEALDALAESVEACEMVLPSNFARSTDALLAFAEEQKLTRLADPLTTLRHLNTTINRAFVYTPKHTRVDSPIDEALASRKGVCQDFSHIFIALARKLGMPCRYVSGYLFHRAEDHDRSAGDATHAWAEALLPDLGWVGFDPTNDLVVADRHIRTAIGRDYDDVPPTRGVFKGQARVETELEVAVRVAPTSAPPVPEHAAEVTTMAVSPAFEVRQQQQQQQQ